MSSVSAVLLDTDVFSVVYVSPRSSDARVPGWRALLTGRRVLISFQTRAEVLSGAMASNWGARRLRDLEHLLRQTPTIRADDEVIDAHATLFTACRANGHALHAKQHTGDRWVAACAIAKDVALLPGDKIYEGAPGLSLVGRQ